MIINGLYMFDTWIQTWFLWIMEKEHKYLYINNNMPLNKVWINSLWLKIILVQLYTSYLIISRRPQLYLSEIFKFSDCNSNCDECREQKDVQHAHCYKCKYGFTPTWEGKCQSKNLMHLYTLIQFWKNGASYFNLFKLRISMSMSEK